MTCYEPANPSNSQSVLKSPGLHSDSTLFDVFIFYFRWSLNTNIAERNHSKSYNNLGRRQTIWTVIWTFITRTVFWTDIIRIVFWTVIIWTVIIQKVVRKVIILTIFWTVIIWTVFWKIIIRTVDHVWARDFRGTAGKNRLSLNPVFV